jgi:hypothetical protein
MRLIAFSLPVIVALGAGSMAYAALPQAHSGPTVNDYTAAQSARAESAARGAGYSGFQITMVQAGDFFLKGNKGGQSYILTVTPNGKVYPSSPSQTTTG